MIDLGRWLGGDYAIAGEPASDEDLAADLQQQDSAKPEEGGSGRGRR